MSAKGEISRRLDNVVWTVLRQRAYESFEMEENRDATLIRTSPALSPKRTSHGSGRVSPAEAARWRSIRYKHSAESKISVND